MTTKTPRKDPTLGRLSFLAATYEKHSRWAAEDGEFTTADYYGKLAKAIPLRLSGLSKEAARRKVGLPVGGRS